MSLAIDIWLVGNFWARGFQSVYFLERDDLSYEYSLIFRVSEWTLTTRVLIFSAAFLGNLAAPPV
jgi:hypothetical protein